MRTIAREGAQVDRVIAVNPKESAVLGAVSHEPNGRLWSEDLLYDMLTKWQILADRSGQKPLDTVSCSDDFQGAQKEIGSIAFESFPSALKNGARSKLSGARIYPMITSPEARTYQTINHIWTPEPLCDAYQELQGGGKYWALPVVPQVEKDLDEHFDVMFIGIGPKEAGSGRAGVWDTNDVDWGMCLMNSSDAAVETMFLSVISDQSARKQYQWWRKRLEDAVEWEKSALPQAAHDWMTKLVPVTTDVASETVPEPPPVREVPALGQNMPDRDGPPS